MMASESQRCVDQLLVRLSEIDRLVNRLETEPSDGVVLEAREVIRGTQNFIDNNKAAIPSYCLKKVADGLRRLESQVSGPQKAKLLFKFKSSPKVSDQKLEQTSELEQDTKREPSEFLPAKFGFHDCLSESLSLGPDEVDSKDVSLVNLDRCSVQIRGSANTVYIRNLKNCSVSVCIACRAVTVTDCRNCLFKIACQQLRIDSTSSCHFDIFTSARSMLESSEGLEFKQLNLDELENPSQVRELLTRANFDPTRNNWKCIDDFDWLSKDSPSRNYKLIH